jgi:hypothetical protein
MRPILRAAAFALPPLLAGCNSAPPQARFDPIEASFIRKEGQTTIEGQAFLRDRHGQMNVRYASGEVVRLIPATAYAQTRFSHFYGAKKYIPALLMPTATQDAEYSAYTRTTKAGPTGRFAFDKVAPGRYFVTTQLTWTPKGAFMSEGGAIYDEVVVTGKETDPIEVVLSGN